MEMFPPVHIVQPTSQHTHTAILLHGRGSTGEEFAEELSDTKLPDGTTLFAKLPDWRWVFPSSRMLWSTAFEEEMPAWFEAHSLTDIAARQDLQTAGIRESVAHLLDSVIPGEIEKLGGSADKLVLGGISQGAAIGLWTLFCHGARVPRSHLGAFVGASAWLPFADNIRAYLEASEDGEAPDSRRDGDAFVADMLASVPPTRSGARGSGAISATPVFLGHGVDDAYIDIELGRQARQVLEQAGLTVEWKEYEGAEQEGHWFKEPEEVEDIAAFLIAHTV